jgi:hypothetical protein
MSEREHSVSDLTVRDVSVVAKSFLGAAFLFAVIFLPFYLLQRGLLFAATDKFGEETTSTWFAWIIGILFLLLIAANLSAFFQDLSEFFADCARMTKGFSWPKRLTVVASLLVYMLAWRHVPDAAFFLTIFVLMPSAVAFEKCQSILRKKS